MSFYWNGDLISTKVIIDRENLVWPFCYLFSVALVFLFLPFFLLLLLFFFFNFYFFGCACSMWKFPGQGSNLCHSSDNIRSLTHWATREIPVLCFVCSSLPLLPYSFVCGFMFLFWGCFFFWYLYVLIPFSFSLCNLYRCLCCYFTGVYVIYLTAVHFKLITTYVQAHTKTSTLYFILFHFLSFQGHTCGIWRFLG